MVFHFLFAQVNDCHLSNKSSMFTKYCVCRNHALIGALQHKPDESVKRILYHFVTVYKYILKTSIGLYSRKYNVKISYNNNYTAKAIRHDETLNLDLVVLPTCYRWSPVPVEWFCFPSQPCPVNNGVL